MLDLNGILDGDLHTRVYSFAAGTLTNYVTWQKPAGCSMVFMLCVGAGGGGGGGRTSAVGTSRGGGGGGGSGAVTRTCLPANILPDVLYVRVGQNGTGGAAGSSGVAGGASSVLASQLSITDNVYCTAGGGGAGGSTTSGTGGAAGSAGSAGVAASSSFIASGNFVSRAGQAGGTGSTAGASGAVGPSKAALANGIVLGGCGGASCGTDNADFDGGSVTAAGVFAEAVTGGAGGTGLPGGNGYTIRKPLCSVGGASGGSSGTGTAGAGGNAGFGSGGGGGGGGVTGGRGGNGGDGLVIIIAW